MKTAEPDKAGRHSGKDPLLAFGHEIARRCREAGHSALAYGGLVYLALTDDRSVGLGDVDFLVVEAAFPELLGLFRSDPSLSLEETAYHSIKLSRGPLKVSFDSLDHYLSGLSPTACVYSIDGLSFDGVDRDTLVEAYARGASTIPQKREAYLHKLATLNRA